ncbi:MAG: hypothetical protein AAFQ45_07240 [Pseudomonadota bacterium]
MFTDRIRRSRWRHDAVSLALVLFATFATASAFAAEITKPQFVAQCAGENSLGSKPACVCLWGKITASYQGEEKKLMTQFFTTSFADWEPSSLSEKRQDELLEESATLVGSCGVDIQP